MKTPQEIAVECASRSEHSYTQVENFIPHNWVLEAMQEYAKQVAIKQRDIDAVNILYEYYFVDGVTDIHNSILSTKLVVD